MIFWSKKNKQKINKLISARLEGIGAIVNGKYVANHAQTPDTECVFKFEIRIIDKSARAKIQRIRQTYLDSKSKIANNTNNKEERRRQKQMFQRLYSKRHIILYDGNVYKVMKRQMFGSNIQDVDLGLSVSHKTYLNIIIRKHFDRHNVPQG